MGRRDEVAGGLGFGGEGRSSEEGKLRASAAMADDGAASAALRARERARAEHHK